MVEITKIALSSLMVFMLIFLVSIITIPIKYVSADSQWTGTVTIAGSFNQTMLDYMEENGTFTFNVAADGTITGSGQETLSPVPDGPLCDTDIPSPTFSVKGTPPQNNTDFALWFTDFSQSNLTCTSHYGPYHTFHYSFVPNLLNRVIELPAKDGTFTKSSFSNQQNITLTIHENSNPIPEFGSVAPTVFVISILSIIILSAKTRFLH